MHTCIGENVEMIYSNWQLRCVIFIIDYNFTITNLYSMPIRIITVYVISYVILHLIESGQLVCCNITICILYNIVI